MLDQIWLNCISTDDLTGRKIPKAYLEDCGIWSIPSLANQPGILLLQSGRSAWWLDTWLLESLYSDYIDLALDCFRIIWSICYIFVLNFENNYL